MLIYRDCAGKKFTVGRSLTQYLEDTIIGLFDPRRLFICQCLIGSVKTRQLMTTQAVCHVNDSLHTSATFCYLLLTPYDKLALSSTLS